MVQKTTLDNGIRVVSEKITSAHSVTLGVWVENGSRHEKDRHNGISHFVEHMLFKGTQRRTAQHIAKEIDSVGGILNAFTSREFSCYYAKVLAKKLPLAVDLLSDIILNSVFDFDEIEKERRVILQEIHMSEDTPEDQIHDLFCQNFWKGHPLGLSILGTAESVEGITRQNILSLMEERYCGANIIVCAAGDLEHDSLIELIGAAFEGIPRGKREVFSEIAEYERSVNLLEKELEQVHICLGTRALSQNHPNRFVAYLLNAILGGSMSSRLFQIAREEMGLVYSIYSYLNSHSDSGALVVSSATSPDEARQVVDIILKEFGRFRNDLVADDELQAAKDQIKGNLLLSMESTDNRMTRLAKNEIYLGSQYSLKDALRSIDRVTTEEIRRLAEFIFNDEYLNLQLIGKARGSDYPLLDLTLG